MKSARPTSIIWFERFYFLSLGIELLNEFVTWPVVLEEVGWEISTYLLMLLLVVILSIVIWYFLAIKAKSWARWAQIIVTGLGVIGLFFEIGAVLAPAIEDTVQLHVMWENIVWPETLTALYVTAIVVNVVATYFLFRGDAISWFDEPRVAIDKVFD